MSRTVVVSPRPGLGADWLPLGQPSTNPCLILHSIRPTVLNLITIEPNLANIQLEPSQTTTFQEKASSGETLQNTGTLIQDRLGAITSNQYIMEPMKIV